MTNPDQRAKLADWLEQHLPNGSVTHYDVDSGDSITEYGDFDFLAHAILSLPVSVRAQLMGLDLRGVSDKEAGNE